MEECEESMVRTIIKDCTGKEGKRKISHSAENFGGKILRNLLTMITSIPKEILLENECSV